MYPHVASTRQAATKILNCLKLLCEFSSRPNTENIGNVAQAGKNMTVIYIVFTTSRFANVWSQIIQMWLIFTHMKLWFAVARHTFKWVRI